MYTLENYTINISNIKSNMYEYGQEYVTIDNCLSMCESFIKLNNQYDYLIGFLVMIILLLLYRIFIMKK
jgi:hypothetical protein